MTATLTHNEIITSLKKNRSQIKQVITHLNRFHIRAVRKGTKVNEFLLDNLFAKIILPLWVSILEIEFSLIVYKDHKISKKFLKSVNFSNFAETNKWNLLIEFLFKERYFNNQNRSLTKTSLGDTTYYRYKTIKEIVEQDIKPFIELRNRIDHGQWAIAFTNLGMSKNQQLTQKVWTLSKKDLMLLKIIIGNFPIVLENLLLSTNAFEKDYDKIIGKINLAKKDIDLRFNQIKNEKKKKTKRRA